MELECLEGRIHGARYYTVRPIFGWWFGGNNWLIQRPNWKDLEDWCTETFGAMEETGVWVENCIWYANNGKFWFRNEADRALFVLRWR